MVASNSLLLDFEPEVNTSALHNDLIWYLGDRRQSALNTTMVVYTYLSTLTDEAKQMVSKVQSFKNLEPNWDSYGAVPPSSDDIDRAVSFIKRADRNLLPFYFAAPGPNGELVLEFRRGNKEAAAYINSDGSTELVMNEGNNVVLEGTLEDNYKDLLKFINF